MSSSDSASPPRADKRHVQRTQYEPAQFRLFGHFGIVTIIGRRQEEFDRVSHNELIGCFWNTLGLHLKVRRALLVAHKHTGTRLELSDL